MKLPPVLQLWNMCNFKVWFQSADTVYVLQCEDCNTYQVRLHNAAFMFDSFSYKCFCDLVSQTWQNVESGCHDEPIVIPTFNNGMSMFLSAAHLAELYYLLDAADTEMKVAHISRLFSSYC